MEFASAVYSGITSQFFDFLVDNINTQFEARCEELTKMDKYSEEIVFRIIKNDQMDSMEGQRTVLIEEIIDPEESMTWMFEPGNNQIK